MRNSASSVEVDILYVSQKTDQKVCPGRLSLLSYPKINLTLDILKQDSSGHHEIRTVFHELSGLEYAEWHDELIFEPQNDSLIELHSDNPHLALDETNTVQKAANLLRTHAILQDRHLLDAKNFPGVKIFIKKRIPLMSGLGGGASNAAAALKGLAKIWGINCCGKLKNAPQNVRTHTSGAPQTYFSYLREAHLSECILFEIAAGVGMDCPFFINGGTALGEHFGEKITPLPSLPPQILFEIINTGVEISSRSAYEAVDLKRCGKNLDKTEKLIVALRAGDAATVIENSHNDFEDFVFKQHPKLYEIKRKFEKNVSGKIFLCGSGGALMHIRNSSPAKN